jgi:hypothetical protein
MLDDGRQVVVDSSRDQTRVVEGEEFFVSPGHVVVLLEGGWQVIRRKRLRNMEYGSPFGALRKDAN